MPGADDLNDYQRAAAIARYVQIQDVALEAIDSKLLVRREEALKAMPWALTISKTVNHSFEESSSELLVHVGLDAAVSEAKTKRTLLSFSSSFVLEYAFAVAGGPTGSERDVFLKAFAEVNGMYNAWPYFREALQSIAARMGLPPVVLPVYRSPSATSSGGQKAAVSPASAKRRSKAG